MSLVIDSLKKIKNEKQTTKGSVPPSLFNLAPKARQKGPNKALLIIFVFVLIGTGIIFFMPTGTSYKVQPPALTNQNQQATTQNTTAPQQTAQAPQAQEQPTAPEQTALPVPSTPQPQQAQVPQQPMAMQNGQPVLVKNSNPALAQNVPQAQAVQQKQTTVQPHQSQDQHSAMSSTNAEAVFNAIIQNQGNAQQALAQQGIQPQTAQNTTQQTAQYTQPLPVVTQKSNPAYTLTGQQKAEYMEKLNYNNLVSSAFSALNSGNNRHAEMLFSQAMAERSTKACLSGLLTAKIRMGEADGVDIYLKKYSRTADASVISSAATEIARAGSPKKAVSLLHRYTSIAGSSQIYYTAAQIQDSTGGYAAAENDYYKAMKAAPNDAYIVYGAARNKDLQQKYSEALVLYRQIDNMNADDDVALNARSRASVLSAYFSRLNQDK